MPTRANEMVTRLRANAPLGVILPGGIYDLADLGIEGVSSPAATPDAYSGGKLRPCAVVNGGGLVPTGQLVDLKERIADVNQTLRITVYQSVESAAILAALILIYDLLQGHAFSRAWGAVLVGELPVMPEPEMVGILMARQDWLVKSLRRPSS